MSRPGTLLRGISIRPFLSREQFAMRVGPHWFGLRYKTFPEYYSEFMRRGWKVRYLPFGWRAFYRRLSL